MSLLLAVFVFVAIVWRVIRMLRGLGRAASGMNPRIKLAKLHMLDGGDQFKVFHSQRVALTSSTAFEQTYGAGGAPAENAEFAAADEVVARALAERQAALAAAPAPAVTPQGFGRRRTG